MSELEIGASIEQVTWRIARAAERSGRKPEAITLVAVTKTVPIARIREAISAGLTDFGENRVQDAEAKFAATGSHVSPGDEQDRIARSGIRLHLIGNLQRNKARRAAHLFDSIASVDKPELAEALDRAAAERHEGGSLPVLLQVNVTGEEGKFGVSPEDLPALADYLQGCADLRGVGLMTIAGLGADESELRRTFSSIRGLLDKLRSSHGELWKELSMGMSDDYEVAIEEGATIVRLGRALFGARDTPAAR